MVENKIIEIIKAELNVDEFELDENLVETYEIDSIGLLDFFMTIEEEFDIEFEDEELENLKTANDIIELVEKKLS
ncbi:MAG: acyl carrier protein [Tissierellia bacterium]|nr:acyl carrier protein [Tissierellia bacterium]